MDLASLAGFSPSGERDDDGSQWFSSIRNATSDYADVFHSLGDRSYAVALAADASAGETQLVVENSLHNDQMFCSLTGEGLLPSFRLCSSDTTLGNHCVSSFDPASGRTRNAVLQVRDARGAGRPAYEMVGVVDYTGCGDDESPTATVVLMGGLRRPARAGDTLQYYLPDGVHLSAWGARWEAQAVWTANYARDFTPNVDLLPNGDAELPCDADPQWRHADASGSGDGLGEIAAGSYDPTAAPAAALLSRAFAGTGCGFQNDAAGGDDFVEVGPVPVEPGALYDLRCMLNGSGGDVVFEVRDVHSGAPLAARRWDCRGECLEQGPGGVIDGAAARGWGRHLLQFAAPGIGGEVVLHVGASADGDVVLLDECSMNRAPIQQAGLQPILPDGAQRLFCMGDSRSNTRDEFCDALDTLLEESEVRDVVLLPSHADTLYLDSRDADNGRQAHHVVTRGVKAPDGTDNFTRNFDCGSLSAPLDCESVQVREPAVNLQGPRPDWLVVKLGRNDVAGGQRTPEQTRNDLENVCADARDSGTRCLVLGEPPSQGDTAELRCNDGAGPDSANCGRVYMRLSALERRGDGAARAPLGWQSPPCSVPVDSDGDHVCDEQDNCSQRPNPLQIDSDLDGFGNACDLDYDNDGTVGLDDFSLLRNAFGAILGQPAFVPRADIGGDGAIGTPEFNAMRLFFGRGPGPSGLACAGTPPCEGP